MRVLLLFLFLFPTPLFAAGVSLVPETVENGGVFLLRWEGPLFSMAVARFNDRVIYLSSTSQGAGALMGSDVEMEPGIYPIEVAVVDRLGRTSFHRTAISVRKASRPVERLSLPPAMVTPRDPEVLKRIGRERTMLNDLFARRSGPALWKSFAVPVADPVNSPFGLRRILNGKPRSPHSGVDFRSPLGTGVRAAAKGRAAFVGNLYYTGHTVILDHGEGLYTLYAHLEAVRCQEGQVLEAGEVLGRVGSSGRSTGPHLHWGGKLRGDRIDPLALVELLGEEKP